ncbi:MAG: CinA family protein [Sulfitobacter sp.]|jgi:nicotinamide-nucleotide amidase|uniref:CinA family protein n=1 Tax=unclassified Sulfitobacter TaxID=196795 RepID=UPI0007C32F42|nr:MULTISPECIES: CinA family protein [unclassified Sulfitobacter]KZX93128.1 damage-inducible protein CinA [Sulfitobacter sp. HI0021]KZX95628.1 damage-inducible protein CinA [Sulfitobacter sp. HI0027]KZZ01332.1 damage-inducible protein CinA [Sulfitobacter sp. HI0076]
MQKSDPLSQPDIADRAQSVLEKLCARDLHIVTAESCTGGLVAALLTDIEGCSHAFERGFVSYTDQSKHELLGVDRALLNACGAVSRPVAIKMAEGAMARSGAQIAVSTTGFAGPGRPEDEEGLVHFALAREGCNTVHRAESFGAIGRDAIRQRCLETILDMLEESLT